MTTPNMGLTEPTPGTGGTPGPEWASEINANLEILDAHDHSPNSGVAIPSSGLNINDDLNFNSTNAYGMRTVRFANQTSTPSNASDLRIVYSKNGELTYRDALGNEVAITSGGSIAGAVGSIGGLSAPAAATYSSITKTFTWTFDTAKAARMANADMIIYPYDGSTAFSNTITLKAPTALAASYSVTLPLAVPTNPNVVSMDGSGVLSAGLASGSAANPSISFTADLGTGLYRSSAGVLGVTLSGIQATLFGGNGVETQPGTASDPAFSFITDADTGVYRFAANRLGITTGGSNRAIFDSTGLLINVNGTVSAPSLYWTTDTNTGFYHVANEVHFASNGTERATLDNSGIKAYSGTTSVPGYSFIGEVDTGLSNIVVNSFSAICGGAEKVRFSPSGMEFMEGATEGGFFKVKVLTGSGASGRVSTATISHGLTTPTILGAMVVMTVGGIQFGTGSTVFSGEQLQIMTRYSATTVTIDWNGDGGGSNAFTGAKTFEIILFYQ